MRKLDKKSLSKSEGILDKLWRSVGKENAYCAVCASLPKHQRINYTQLHPHHIIGRGHHITRWDLMNRIWLCSYHHTFGRHSAHLNAIWFSEWMKKNKPEEYEYLQGKQYINKDWKIDELLSIYEGLKV